MQYQGIFVVTVDSAWSCHWPQPWRSGTPPLAGIIAGSWIASRRHFFSIGRDALLDCGANRLFVVPLELRAVLDLIAGGTFSHGDTEVFKPLVDNLRYDDPFLVCADFASYLAAQEQVGAAWLDKDAWTKMSILNTARSGKFSSDRAIAEYCDEIWNVWPLSVTM